MMRAGRLKERVTIQVLNSQENKYGEEREDWHDLLPNIRAGVEPISSKEYFAAHERNAELTTRIIVRYRALPHTIRFIHKGVAYYPQGQPINRNSNNISLEYLCSERR